MKNEEEKSCEVIREDDESKEAEIENIETNSFAEDPQSPASRVPDYWCELSW